MRTPVIVVGAHGKLGSMICQELEKFQNLYECVRIVREPTAGAAPSDSHEAFASFSAMGRSYGLSPREKKSVVVYAVKGPVLRPRLQEAIQHGFRYHLIASTGLDGPTKNFIRDWANGYSVVHAPNFSETVMRAAEVCATLAAQLADADVEIIEAHHRNKADAPSGTAEFLARVIILSRSLAGEIVTGRTPGAGKRLSSDIFIHSVRGGTVVGEHKVVFHLDGERLAIEHIAETRALFARGAVKTVNWLAKVNEGPGLFGMPHILNLPRLIELWPKLF